MMVMRDRSNVASFPSRASVLLILLNDRRFSKRASDVFAHGVNELTEPAFSEDDELIDALDRLNATETGV